MARRPNARTVAIVAVLVLVGGLTAAATRLGRTQDVSVRTGAAPETLDVVETSLPVTTVTIPVTVPTLSITIPTLSRPTAPRRPASPAVTTTRRPAAKCGDGWGYGDLGGSHTNTVGTVTAVLAVYPCPAYDIDDPEQLQVEVHSGDTVVHAHLDFGDGTAYDLDGQLGCDPKRPNPWYLNPPRHSYPPGTYHVVATIGTAECDPTTTEKPTVADQETTVSIDAQRFAGRRP